MKVFILFFANYAILCSGSQSVAMDQDYNGWEKGTDKKSQIRSFS